MIKLNDESSKVAFDEFLKGSLKKKVIASWVTFRGFPEPITNIF